MQQMGEEAISPPGSSTDTYGEARSDPPKSPLYLEDKFFQELYNEILSDSSFPPTKKLTPCGACPQSEQIDGFGTHTGVTEPIFVKQRDQKETISRNSSTD